MNDRNLLFSGVAAEVGVLNCYLPLTTFFVSEKTYLKELEIPELNEEDMPMI